MNEVTRLSPEAPTPMMAMIERIALDPNVSIEKLERMLAMQERIQSESARGMFNAAFAAASSEFPSIPLNGRGDKNKPYALLKDILGVTRPVLARHGLALSFSFETHPNHITVTAELIHVAGHSKSTSLELPKDTSGSKNAVQAVGSSTTYGERYTAQAILGLSLGDDVDDDGKAISDNGTINADEFFELRTLLEEAEADEAKFLAYLKVSRLEDLRRQMFPNAVSALRKKIKAKEAA